MSGPHGGTTSPAIKPLTRREIQQRIQEVVCEVSGVDEMDEGSDFAEWRWVEPRELVRRMRPYLVLN